MIPSLYEAQSRRGIGTCGSAATHASLMMMMLEQKRRGNKSSPFLQETTKTFRQK
jgi:hypothetical protein